MGKEFIFEKFVNMWKNRAFFNISTSMSNLKIFEFMKIMLTQWILCGNATKSNYCKNKIKSLCFQSTLIFIPDCKLHGSKFLYFDFCTTKWRYENDNFKYCSSSKFFNIVLLDIFRYGIFRQNIELFGSISQPWF